MALRPVSELGLVDLTDLASPEPDASGRRTPRPAGGAKRASPTTPGEGQPGARSRPRGDGTGKTTWGASQVAPQPRSPRAQPGLASAARVGILAATWAVAGAGGVLLGRAAVRR